MDEITDADYIHGKRVCKDSEIKHLVEYDDLYLKSDALLQMFFKILEKFFLKFLN